MSSLVLVRHERRGVFDAQAMTILTLLYPHVRRAVLIGRVIGEAQARADTLAAALDALSAGVFSLTAKGGIVTANASGRALLGSGGPAREINGRIDFRDDDAARALRLALAAASAEGGDFGGRGVAIPLAATNGDEFMAHLLPLDAERRAAIEAGGDAALVLFVKKLDPAGAAAAAAVAERFRLTPQETRVLRAVVDLGGVPLAADILGVSATTVRTHVTSIFDKTGVRSQAGLVRLLMEAASPFAAPTA